MAAGMPNVPSTEGDDLPFFAENERSALRHLEVLTPFRIRLQACAAGFVQILFGLSRSRHPLDRTTIVLFGSRDGSGADVRQSR
jgi:hypothetical protein